MLGFRSFLTEKHAHNTFIILTVFLSPLYPCSVKRVVHFFCISLLVQTRENMGWVMPNRGLLLPALKGDNRECQSRTVSWPRHYRLWPAPHQGKQVDSHRDCRSTFRLLGLLHSHQGKLLIPIVTFEHKVGHSHCDCPVFVQYNLQFVVLFGDLVIFIQLKLKPW